MNWLIASLLAIAGAAGVHSVDSVVKTARNADFFVVLKLLILRASPSDLIGPLATLGNWRLNALAVQFDRPTDGHRWDLSEEGRDQRFESFHLPKFPSGDAFLFHGQSGAFVRVDFALLGDNPFSELFQGVFPDGHGDVLEVFQVGQVKPCLRGILAQLCASAAVHHSVDLYSKSRMRPYVEHGPVILDNEIRHLGSWHRVQSFTDNPFQALVHSGRKVTKCKANTRRNADYNNWQYALDPGWKQYVSRAIGTRYFSATAVNEVHPNA